MEIQKPLQFKIKRLHPEAVIPKYATPGSAGMDLVAIESVAIKSGGWAPVRTGIALELPPGFEAQIRPRSGLAKNCGVTVLNSPATIDSDYRGEIVVLLIAHGFPYRVVAGDKIAQLVIAPIAQVTFTEVDELEDSYRGQGGFGSTGI